ncbi:MAG: hypothetical protein ABJC61_14110 [Acidobacteriota bacterium]
MNFRPDGLALQRSRESHESHECLAGIKATESDAIRGDPAGGYP